MTATLAGWIDYAALRGSVIANNPAAEQALVRGQDYITYHYIAQFLPGYGPDSPFVDEAVYEAAALELATPGFWTTTFTANQQKVLTGVDKIKWTPVMSTDSLDAWANATPTSTKIAAMLDRYMPGKHNVGLRSIGE